MTLLREGIFFRWVQTKLSRDAQCFWCQIKLNLFWLRWSLNGLLCKWIFKKQDEVLCEMNAGRPHHSDTYNSDSAITRPSLLLPTCPSDHGLLVYINFGVTSLTYEPKQKDLGYVGEKECCRSCEKLRADRLKLTSEIPTSNGRGENYFLGASIKHKRKWRCNKESLLPLLAANS